MEIHNKDRFAVLPSDLKMSNRIQILEMFKSGKTLTVNEIAEKIGVSRQTVMKAVQFFIGKGLIVSAGKADSGSLGGKRAELFELSEDQYLMSVRLWPDGAAVTLMNFRAAVIGTVHPELEQDRIEDFEYVLSIVGESIQTLLKENDIAPEMLRGVCVSTTGTIDYSTGKLRYTARMPQWGKNIPVANILADYLPESVPVFVENVAKVVAHSALHDPEHTSRNIVTMLSKWDNIFACFIENDRIRNGRNSLIGEVGHMILRPDDEEVCACGNRGCFERLVSTDRLRRIMKERGSAHPDSILPRIDPKVISIADVFDAAKDQDTLAVEIADRIAEYFAMVLRMITLTFDPEIIVFQGDLGKANDYAINRLREYMDNFRYVPDGGNFEFVLDDRPIEMLDLKGAYTLMLDKLFSDTKLYE